MKLSRKKPSKRIEASKRYKIEKKVRDHNKKVRRQAKKNPKAKQSKVIKIPNECPFKEDILREVEALKKQKEEEKQKLREEARQKRKEQLAGNIQSLVSQAQNKQNQHEAGGSKNTAENTKSKVPRDENSLKAYYKEFKKVIDAADVILEVVDARDPLGTRCKQVEETVRSTPGNKRLVLVLNKADLVPRENLDQWLKYLRNSLPAVAFKSSTQVQTKKLGRKKLGAKKEDMIQNNTCFGAELLLSLLGNYCRNTNGIKTSITVGIVGLPNVGKSSVINSLKRSKACSVGNTPGVTKSMQIVQLDSKVKLLDSPGIVFVDTTNDEFNETIALKNAVKIASLKDPFVPATAILKRIPKQQIMELYDIPSFATPDEFFAKKAHRMGMFKKRGILDVESAARSILNDWNSGKIRYYTVPPELPSTEISTEIVKEFGEEFDLEKFSSEEKMMLDSVADIATQPKIDPLIIESTGPMEIPESEKKKEFKLQKMNEKMKKKGKDDSANRKKKTDPLHEIEGNQRLNKMNKLQQKKQKKQRAKQEKAATNLAEQLEDFKLQDTTTDKYNFDTDFSMADQ